MQSDGHISVDDLESYKLAEFDGLEVAALEEYLQSCLYCRDRLLAIGQFLDFIQEGSLRVPWKRDQKG